jgi:hypothetical protein
VWQLLEQVAQMRRLAAQILWRRGDGCLQTRCSVPGPALKEVQPDLPSRPRAGTH